MNKTSETDILFSPISDCNIRKVVIGNIIIVTRLRCWQQFATPNFIQAFLASKNKPLLMFITKKGLFQFPINTKCNSQQLVREFIARRGRRTQPLTLPCTTTGSVIVVIIVHFHVAAITAVVCATCATGEFCVLVLLDNFFGVHLIHYNLPF